MTLVSIGTVRSRSGARVESESEAGGLVRGY